MRRWLKRVFLGGFVLLVLIQFVPYGRDHTNPPGSAEPAWPSARVRELAERACFDCHSHATRWPWYSHVAPMSWLVARDVKDGRKHLNFSAWDKPQKNASKASDELEEGEMPPWFYLPLHADARLTDAEKAELVQGLKALPPPPGSDGGRGKDGSREREDGDDKPR